MTASRNRKNSTGRSKPRSDRRLIGSSSFGESRYNRLAVRSNASSTQTNQIGPLGHGPTVTVFHQNAAKPISGCCRSAKRVIGDRNDRERGDHERQAEPEQAVAQEDRRRLVRKARPDEQPGQKKEHRHEEAVGGENDHVEADPEFGIGVTEIGVGDDRMVEQHHQRQEGAGAVEREVARACLWRRLNFGGRRGM